MSWALSVNFLLANACGLFCEFSMRTSSIGVRQMVRVLQAARWETWGGGCTAHIQVSLIWEGRAVWSVVGCHFLQLLPKRDKFNLQTPSNTLVLDFDRFRGEDSYLYSCYHEQLHVTLDSCSIDCFLALYIWLWTGHHIFNLVWTFGNDFESFLFYRKLEEKGRTFPSLYFKSKYKTFYILLSIKS